MDQSINIRPATLDDAAAILAIYAPFIEKTAVTFEYEVPSVEEFRDRMADIMAEYPYLVAERTAPSREEDAGGAAENTSAGHEEARVAGYAYAHRMGERAAYQWNAELAVYLAPEAQGRGLGGQLVTELERELAARGVRNVFSVITASNLPSIRLHEKLGYTQVGLHPNAGYKLGEWHDVAYLRKAIGSFEGEPQPYAGRS